MTELVKDQEFLVTVVKAIVNHPEDVEVTRDLDERGVLLTLKVNQEDMGYVIGRRFNCQSHSNTFKDHWRQKQRQIES